MGLKKPVVIITGASGLIGSSLARLLADRCKVVGFDIKEAEGLPHNVDFIKVDLTSDESVIAGLQEVRNRHGGTIASVVHLAAYYDFSGEPSPLYDEITVQGTGRLLGVLQQFDVEQLIFSSTMLVHAPCEPGQRIDESWPIEPTWDYPRSKVETEDLLRAKHDNIPLLILRIAGIYDDECHSLPIANQIQRIYERRLTSKVYPGDLDRGQAFLHLEDLIEALELAIQKRADLPSELTLLLGEPETLGYGDLQKQMGRLIHNEEWETRYVPRPVAKVGAWVQENMPFTEDPFIKPWMVDMADDHYALDISRARSTLGWEPRHRLGDAIPAMIEALKRSPEAWYRENKLSSED